MYYGFFTIGKGTKAKGGKRNEKILMALFSVCTVMGYDVGKCKS